MTRHSGYDGLDGDRGLPCGERLEVEVDLDGVAGSDESWRLRSSMLGQVRECERW